MSTAHLYDLLVACADEAIGRMSADGSLPAGNNGPWNDPETPVRNTGHWLLTFLKVHETTGDDRYRSAAKRATEYLLSSDRRPHGATFYHRLDGSQDRCNGLIGQAWTIEALVGAADGLEHDDALEVAESVFLSHPFDERLAAWKIVDIDGSVIGFDMTFNHQLWFAAAGALLAEQPGVDPAIDAQVTRFLDEVDANMNVYDSGVIRHLLKPEFDVPKYATVFVDGLRRGTAHKMVAGQLRSIFGRSEEGDGHDVWHERAIGYHSFNLYAFAILNECYPSHDVWKTSVFDQALSFATGEEFPARLDGNPYGYPYNCSGIEMAYVVDVFGDADRDSQREWLRRQLTYHYDSETKMLSRDTPDPETLTARLYEATRLPNVRLPESID